MHICFATDLHGSESLYQQLDRLVRREEPDLLILGGDMFPDGDDRDPVGTQTAYVCDAFLPRVRGWKRRLADLTVACILGNHDWLTLRQTFQVQHEAGRIVLLDLHRPWQCGYMKFVGYWHTPPTPFWLKDFERLDMPGDTPADMPARVWDPQTGRIRDISAVEHYRRCPPLSADLAAVGPIADPWVFVCHAPPWGTNLDRLPNVDHPVGSKAIRQFIESRRPYLALHGHIHDSPDVSGAYTDELNGTLCINPGQSTERLYAVMFELQRPRETLRHTVYG